MIYMKNSKKGFSLVECIVAIAVIVIITTAAITTFTAAQGATNKEWENYLATTAADASVSAFQSADNLGEFASRLPDGVKGLGDTAGGLETVTPQAIPFAAIRAYEEGKVVKLFNHQLDVNNDSYTDAIATFNYGSQQTEYKNDKQYLDGLSFYNKVLKESESSVLTTAFKFSQTKGTSYMTMGGERTDPNAATIDFNDGKVTITDNSKKTKSYEQTDLEAYLLSKGQFLGFADNTNVGNTMCPTPIMYESSKVFYFYVYQLDYTKNPIVAARVKSGRNYKVLRVTYDNAPFSSADKSSWNTEKYIHVTSVKFDWVPLDDYTGNNTEQAKYNEYFTDDNGEKFEDFNWYGFPLYAYYCNGTMDEGRTPDWELKGGIMNVETSKKLVYTDYTLKSGAAVSSLKIDYALYKNSETSVYTDENSTLLYKYTGGDALSVLTSLGMTKRGTEGAYDKYQKVSVTVSEVNAGYFYYLPEGSSVGCFINAAYSDAWNGERKIQAWVMNKDDIAALISKSPEEIAESITQAPTYSYRKA